MSILISARILDTWLRNQIKSSSKIINLGSRANSTTVQINSNKNKCRSSLLIKNTYISATTWRWRMWGPHIPTRVTCSPFLLTKTKRAGSVTPSLPPFSHTNRGTMRASKARLRAQLCNSQARFMGSIKSSWPSLSRLRPSTTNKWGVPHESWHRSSAKTTRLGRSNLCCYNRTLRSTIIWITISKFISRRVNGYKWDSARRTYNLRIMKIIELWAFINRTSWSKIALWMTVQGTDRTWVKSCNLNTAKVTRPSPARKVWHVSWWVALRPRQIMKKVYYMRHQRTITDTVYWLHQSWSCNKLKNPLNKMITLLLRIPPHPKDKGKAVGTYMVMAKRLKRYSIKWMSPGSRHRELPLLFYCKKPRITRCERAPLTIAIWWSCATIRTMK